MPDTPKFELVSPERLLVSAEVEQVLVPGSEGDFTMHPVAPRCSRSLRPGLLGKWSRAAPGAPPTLLISCAAALPRVLAETAVDLASNSRQTLIVQAIKDAGEDGRRRQRKARPATRARGSTASTRCRRRSIFSPSASLQDIPVTNH